MCSSGDILFAIYPLYNFNNCMLKKNTRSRLMGINKVTAMFLQGGFLLFPEVYSQHKFKLE